jgi:hypothetical protein
MPILNACSQRLTEYVAALRAIHHPNVAPFHDIHLDSKFVALTRPYYSRSVIAYLKSKGAIDEIELSRMVSGSPASDNNEMTY